MLITFLTDCTRPAYRGSNAGPTKARRPERAQTEVGFGSESTAGNQSMEENRASDQTLGRGGQMPICLSTKATDHGKPASPLLPANPHVAHRGKLIGDRVGPSNCFGRLSLAPSASLAVEISFANVGQAHQYRTAAWLR
jgi:hypothetical protein